MESKFDKKVIEQELENITASEQFKNATRLTKFLRYVVTETLAGNASRLKAYRIAVDAFDRNDFDSLDPYIRNVAKDTRRALSAYYQGHPDNDTGIQIQIPKGKYVSYFVRSNSDVGDQANSSRLNTNTFKGYSFKPTIAVIPLRAVRCEESNRFIGEIFADDLINKISGQEDFNVISRLSTTAFSRSSFDMDEVKHLLHADYLVSGTFSHTNKHIKIFVELADTNTGFVVFSEQIHLAMQKFINADEHFVANIVNKLSSSITRNEIEKVIHHNPLSLENYTLLISAIHMLHRITNSDFRKAKELLDVLIDRNTRSPLPHAWTAKWHVLNHVQGNVKDIDYLKNTASDCAKKALDLDSTCAMALTVDGLVHTNILRQLDVAETRYNDAIQSNPSDCLARALKGTLHAFKGEGEEALNNTELAMRLSPLDPMKYYYLSLASTAALSAERYDTALDYAQQSLKLNPYHASTLRAAAVANVHLDDQEAAEKSISNLLKLDPEFTVSRFLAESPSADYKIGQQWADSLRQAGVPQ